MANLLVLKGTNPGATLPLAGDKIVLGRNADCGIVINMPAVSREHALIRKIQSQFWIEDLKSRNGTQLNNVDVKKSTLLKHNEDSLDRGLSLLGPFYRVFANVIGNGRWFDNYIQNLSVCGVFSLVLKSGTC